MRKDSLVLPKLVEPFLSSVGAIIPRAEKLWLERKKRKASSFAGLCGRQHLLSGSKGCYSMWEEVLELWCTPSRVRSPDSNFLAGQSHTL